MKTPITANDNLGKCLRQKTGHQDLGETGKDETKDDFNLIAFGSDKAVQGGDLDKTGALITADDEEIYQT